MASKITSKGPALRRLSKWITIGGLGMTALGVIFIAFFQFQVLLHAMDRAHVFGCPPGFPEPPCTGVDLLEESIGDFMRTTTAHLLWLGVAISSIAFIAWANVSRW